jgi:hypothetical protein
MRLRSAPECAPASTLAGVRFKMAIGPMLVNCCVTSDALKRCAARAGKPSHDLVALFLAFRKPIEAIARVQFEAGVPQPIVSGGQL